MADELGTNLPVLSMAWILQHPEISCVIAGASKPSQLENNMKAAGFVIPADAMAEIDKITGFPPLRTSRRLTNLRLPPTRAIVKRRNRYRLGLRPERWRFRRFLLFAR